jgi:hypothetical protein
MTSRTGRVLLAGAILSVVLIAREAQAQADQGAAAGPPAVGQIAPDFALSGATRYGLLRSPVKLSDFRGNTVVIAFFYQARTKG